MPESYFLVIVASGFLFAAIVLWVYALAPQRSEKAEYVPIIHRGHLGNKRDELKTKYPLYRLFIPIISYVSRYIASLRIDKLRTKIRKKLLAAGNPGAFSADEFMALRIVIAFFLPLFMWFMIILMYGNAQSLPLIMMISSGLGAFYPTIWLGDIINKRVKLINRALPYTLDLLTLSIEAGLDFVSSVERIVMKKKHRGPLSDELFQMLQELKMGKTRREALRDMATRVNIDNVSSVVSAMIQADQLGTSLGPILRIQSEMLRLRRSQRAEKLAMEAPVKMLFPLLFIFAAVFLLLFGPVIIKFFRGGLF
ncbi:type II secretion system F family protein [candidate division CSSED10-310 bacterium]|uniref:Type II secretion system F family protein n=1 Tax=candidate division CSSED10-310 bacterium TaxID=2855610 RepID=A0ABV6YXQ5_UNCC1